MADNEAADVPPPAAGSSHLLHMGAGCWSGLCSDALTHPLSTLRARLMVERQRSKLSLGRYASQVVRQEGARSLYRGIGMALLGSLPGSALFYLGYEVGKEKLSRVPGMQKDVSHLLAGTAATLSGSFIYSPMEVVVQKTQTQVRAKDPGRGAVQEQWRAGVKGGREGRVRRRLLEGSTGDGWMDKKEKRGEG